MLFTGKPELYIGLWAHFFYLLMSLCTKHAGNIIQIYSEHIHLKDRPRGPVKAREREREREGDLVTVLDIIYILGPFRV